MDGFDSRRLHHFPPVNTGSIHYRLLCFPYLSPVRAVEEPDRRLFCRRTEVHIPLRRQQIGMTGQLLNGSCRCASHGQTRTERMSQNMHTVSNTSPTRRTLNLLPASCNIGL